MSLAATASLLTGLLRTAKAASKVTEEEQDKFARADVEDWKDAQSAVDAPRGAA